MDDRDRDGGLLLGVLYALPVGFLFWILIFGVIWLLAR